MKPFSLNIHGRLREYTRPLLMGILNVTADSFYSGSHNTSRAQVKQRVTAMIAEGVDIIDVGGYSSRPGAQNVSEREELERVRLGVETIRDSVGSDVPVSVDTFRSTVAKEAVVHFGADIVNDISGGMADERMFETVAGLRVPYVLMHMRGTPETMQSLTRYDDVTADVIAELSKPLNRLTQLGVADVIVDPGFGFAKTLEQNYDMMRNLLAFDKLLRRPLLVGISRKSMITRLCGITPEEALPGTVALNTYALLNGASILRVHDVAAARQAIDTVAMLTGRP